MEHNSYRRGGRRREHIIHYNINGGVSTSSTDEELDPWTAWAYKPRTISLLFIGACFLIWASGALTPETSSSPDLVTSVKRGIWAMIAVFLTYCLLQAPSTLLIRPHPAIWRLVHGMAVIYLVALTFLLFQNRDDARQLMKYLDPDLGVELPERSYGADCRLYVAENPTSRFINVYDTLFDEFVPAHIFGWWGKAIMIRNQPLLWVLSIGFELMEVRLLLLRVVLFGITGMEWLIPLECKKKVQPFFILPHGMMGPFLKECYSFQFVHFHFLSTRWFFWILREKFFFYFFPLWME